MSKCFFRIFLLLCFLSLKTFAMTDNSRAYLFAYFTDKNDNKNGLHFAWSKDGYKWDAIGPEHSFLKCDYGNWGSEKKMRDPFIMLGPDSLWHCLWTINWEIDIIGHASTKDFIHWSRQSYIPVMKGYETRNCWAPEMIYDDKKQQYIIFWASTIKENGEWKTEPGKKYDNRMYYTTTNDFKTFAPAKIFFDPGHNVIDATIRKEGNTYYMIYKDETEVPEARKNLLVAVSENAEGPYRCISKSSFTKNWVEGPAICRLQDSSYIVYMDAYMDKRYEAMRTRDFKSWEDVSDRISVPADAKHASIISVTMDDVNLLIEAQKEIAYKDLENRGKGGIQAPKPVYRDPVYDGAADPVVIWNPLVNKWWMFYTNRRANQTSLPGVSWVFGTPIGIAESVDGANWSYIGIANFGQLPSECGGKNATLWAPDIVLGDDGKWHMYLSIQPGIDVKWGIPGFIAHLTSINLRDWKYESRLNQLGTRVIDADILKMSDGTWRMYYKDSNNYSHISMTESKDLYTWSDPVEILKINGEGPITFYWKDNYWLIIDSWKGQTVYRSKDAGNWELQPGGNLLPDDEGTGLDDIPNGLHANVVVNDQRVYMYYFTHPGRTGDNKKKDGYEQRRTSIQVVELELDKDGRITADRNHPTYIQLFPETPVKATITVNASASKPISDQLIGVFFEDINYAADGGLYAELVENRGFEYDQKDVAGHHKDWNNQTSWELLTFENAQGTFSIDSTSPLHKNTPHYAVLKVENPGNGVGLANGGFDGIVLHANQNYNLSIFARNLRGKKGELRIQLVNKNGEVLAETKTKKLSGKWAKYTAVLTPGATEKDARLVVITDTKGQIALDMISLFPENTFKNRPNGLRADLAQAIADINPRFIRFPGGCLVHGDGLDNMYRWKNTVGPVEQRKPQANIWRYHQTAGLGYFEYFQFCEDIGAEPLPIVPAGVCCQNSRHKGQEGIPMCEMHDYVQEILDLIEWANGDASTNWGKVRAQAGHPEPFNLKYIGVGNEDLISDIFEERFRMIYEAVKKKHPEITVVGTVGPFCEGTDYVEGWKIADKLQLPVVDEHYYQSPDWFINNQDFYDKYNRSGSKVYLGEYASRGNRWFNALAEASYMTALERNGDIVSMTSYAPLLAKEGHTQWNPDLIYFNNTEIKPTVNYYIQQLYGNNAGDQYISSNVVLFDTLADIKKRISVSVVKDTKSGDLIIKMVNILPVSVKADILFTGIENMNPKAVKTIMQGQFDDKKLQPVVSDFSIGKTTTYEIPARSFTVIRVNTLGK